MKQQQYLFKKSSIPIISFMLFVVYLFPKNIAYYTIPVLFAIIFIFDYKNIIRNIGIKTIFITPLFLSLLHSIVVTGTQDIIRYLPIILMILLCRYKGISFKYVTFITTVITVILISTQIAIALDMSVVTELRNYLYPIEKDVWAVGVSELNLEFNRSKRYGGIYYNPNVLGQMLVFSYLFILLSDLKLPIKFLLSSFILMSLLLTGSRTAIIIYFISTIIFYFYNSNIKRKYIVKTIVIVFSFTSLFIAGVMVESIMQGVTDPADSLYIKTYILIDYFDNISGVASILLGSGATNIQFDSDIGNIIANFGLLSFISIVAFIMYLYYKTEKQLRYVFTIFLFMFSNTLIYNLQSSIVLLTLLMVLSYKTRNNF